MNTYRLVKPGKMDEEPTFYVNDEVGCAISHSDAPNTRLAPIIYSPDGIPDDPKTMTFTLMWTTQAIKKEQYFERDYLWGITEHQWRSARLFTWFDVFPEYFEQEWVKFQQYKSPFEVEKIHQKLQEDYPSPSSIDAEGVITVYSDYVEVGKYLNDKRFKMVDDPRQAKILWLTEDYEQKRFLEWNIDLSKTYVNFFKKEGAIVIKNHLANLVNTVLTDKSCIQQTFDLNLSAPNFMGCYLERKKKGLDNTWIIKPVSMARSMDTWVTNNAE